MIRIGFCVKRLLKKGRDRLFSIVKGIRIRR